MMMEDNQQKTDQIAYHFYTKLFSLVHDARVTVDPHSLRYDKWFNLESPDSDLFTRDAREVYKSITRQRPPPFELEVVLCIPQLSPNQAVVYLPPAPSSVRQPIEPTPDLIVLEVWSVSLSGAENPGVTPPPIYKHGMALFRSIYTLLRTLPAWALYKRIRRRVLAHSSALSISLRLRPPSLSSPSSSQSSGSVPSQSPYRPSVYSYPTHKTLELNQQPAPSLSPIQILTQDFPAVQLPPGTLTFSVTYLTNPCFEIDELESVLSSRFTSYDVGGEFVPTLVNKSSSKTTSSKRPSGNSDSGENSPPRPGETQGPGADTKGNSTMRSSTVSAKEANESIAERFILPSKAGVSATGGSPKDPLARLRRESTSGCLYHHPIATSPSPTSSPRQRKLSLNSSTSSSIISQSPFFTANTTTPSAMTNPIMTAITSPTTTSTSPLPIRRPNLNPFKSNTISSPSSSSPSVSLRSNTQIPPPTKPMTIVGSGLSAHAPPPSALAGQPSSVSSTQSNVHLRRGSIGGSLPPPSPIISQPGGSGERESKMTPLSTISAEHTVFPSGEGGGPSSPVPVPPPTRKRYSSSFEHRYLGNLGSNTSGNALVGGSSGKVPTVETGRAGITVVANGSENAEGSTRAQRPGTPDIEKPSYLHMNPDEDDISMFVQEIDTRKPLIGRAREYQSTRSGSSCPHTQQEAAEAPSRCTPPNQVIYGPEPHHEPLSQLHGIGISYGLAGINNWAAFAVSHKGLSLKDSEGEGEGRSSKCLGHSTSTLAEHSSLLLNPNLGQCGASTSPVASPTLLQKHHQIQQARRGVSRSPETGGGRLSVSPPNISKSHSHSYTRNLTSAGVIGVRTAVKSPSPPPPNIIATTVSPVQFPSCNSMDSCSSTTSAEVQVQQAYRLSTSPTSSARGPMLTNQEEVGERLRRMNEIFLRSLEGITLGGQNGERERRRREREREMERERERRERERLTEKERGVRNWKLERERERRYHYGYDSRTGLGLGFFPAAPTSLSHISPMTPSRAREDKPDVGHSDNVASVEIDIDGGVLSSLQPGNEEEQLLSPLIPEHGGVMVTSETGGHSFQSFQPPYQPATIPLSTTSTLPHSRPSYFSHSPHFSPHSPSPCSGGTGASSYSEGSEEVIGRMEISISCGGDAADRLIERDGREPFYDRERERERRHGIGGSRFRQF